MTVLAAAGGDLEHRVATALTLGIGMLALAPVLVVALIVRTGTRCSRSVVTAPAA